LNDLPWKLAPVKRVLIGRAVIKRFYPGYPGSRVIGEGRRGREDDDSGSIHLGVFLFLLDRRFPAVIACAPKMISGGPFGGIIGNPVKTGNGPAAVCEDDPRDNHSIEGHLYESMGEGAGSRMIRESEDLPNIP